MKPTLLLPVALCMLAASPVSAYTVITHNISLQGSWSYTDPNPQLSASGVISLAETNPDNGVGVIYDNRPIHIQARNFYFGLVLDHSNNGQEGDWAYSFNVITSADVVFDDNITRLKIWPEAIHYDGAAGLGDTLRLKVENVTTQSILFDDSIYPPEYDPRDTNPYVFSYGAYLPDIFLTGVPEDVFRITTTASVTRGGFEDARLGAYWSYEIPETTGIACAALAMLGIAGLKRSFRPTPRHPPRFAGVGGRRRRRNLVGIRGGAARDVG